MIGRVFEVNSRREVLEASSDSRCEKPKGERTAERDSGTGTDGNTNQSSDKPARPFPDTLVPDRVELRAAFVGQHHIAPTE